MDGKVGRSNRKRPFVEDSGDDDNKTTHKQKKVRFPKGKKVKPGEEAPGRAGAGDGSSKTADASLAATERAMHRNQINAGLFDEEINDISAADVTYEDNEDFDEDGIPIEPFNLEKEREEGYFDAQGNFVEYVKENEIKDAWLDSVEADPRYAAKSTMERNNEESEHAVRDLSSEDIAIIKRRIASLLEPGETVLQALRRLKGGTNKSKEKMLAETQLIFDQLTEDANKLLEHGEYNVYHDKQEIFKREAGYERLALARGKGTSTSMGQDSSGYLTGNDLSSNVGDLGTASSLLNTDVGTSNLNAPGGQPSRNGADEFDMFADDEEADIAKPSSDSGNLAISTNSNGLIQQPSRDLDTVSETGALQNDYAYDETSGYYYNSSSGYYYDPSTGFLVGTHSTSRLVRMIKFMMPQQMQPDGAISGLQSC